MGRAVSTCMLSLQIQTRPEACFVPSPSMISPCRARHAGCRAVPIYTTRLVRSAPTHPRLTAASYPSILHRGNRLRPSVVPPLVVGVHAAGTKE